MKLLFAFVLFALPAFSAANMVLGGISINADGQIIGTFSPCSTPLTPSTMVSGITVTNSSDPNAQTVVSATTSGCTLTVTTYGVASQNFPAFIDDLVANISITIASGSNLADNAGNTVSATGNTGLHPASNNSAVVPVMGTYASTHLRVDGNPAVDNRGGTALGAAWAGTGGCVRFVSDVNVTSFNVLGLNFSNIMTSWQNTSTALVTQAQTSDGEWSLYSMGSGLSGANTYEVCESNNANAGNSATLVITAIQLVGGTFGARPAYKPWWWVFGASEMACNNGGTTNDTQCPAWMTLRRMGYSTQEFGIAGIPVTNNSACVGVGCTVNNFSPNTLMDCAIGTIICKTNNVPKGSDPPFSMLVDPGGNDAIANTIIGSNYTTPGTFKGDSVTMLSNLVTNYGTPTSGKIYIFDQYCAPGLGSCTAPGSNLTFPWMQAWDGVAAAYNALATGVTAVSGASFLWGCTNPTNGAPDFIPMGFHLTYSGNTNWANCFLPSIAGITGSSYSTGGSLTGSAGSPSTSVTITLNGINGVGTAAFFSTGNSGTQPQTVTLTSTNGADTFAITGGTGGSTCASPCTVVPTNGASTFSYRVTAASSGARTISTTNGQGLGWINPASLGYTAGASAAPTFAPIF